MPRSNWIDIQFQREDSEQIRLEKLRRMSAGIGDLARTVQLLDAGLQLTQDATGNVMFSGGTAELAVTIANQAVTNVKLADMAADTFKGRIGSTGQPLDLTVAQMTSALNAAFDHGVLLGLGDDDHPQYVLRSILTADGDLFSRAAGEISRVAIGTAAQVLRVSAGTPAWQTVSPVLTLGTDLSGNTTFTDLGNATLNATVVSNAITDAKIRDSAGLSVVGRSANSIGDPGDIVGADGQILRVSGTTLGFGSILAASVSDFTAAARAAITVTDTASVDLTYAAGAISAAVLPAGVDHDSLLNYVAAQHVNHTGVTLTAGAGLTGGGDISASRTFDVGAGTGVTVNANDVAVNVGTTFTWTNQHTFSLSGSTATPSLLLSSAQPIFTMDETDQASGERRWLFGLVGRTLQYRTTADDGTGSIIWQTITRGAGAAITNIAVGDTTNNNTYTFGSTGAATFGGQVIAAALVPTGGAAPTNGLYLPGSNTLGLAANSVLQFQLGDSYSDARTQARWTGVNSPAQLVANTNDFTGAAGNFTVVRFSTDAARNITGATGGVAGRFALFINIGTQTAAFTNEDAASTAGNRFLNATAGNKTVQAGGSILYWYDGTSSRWRQVAAIA